MIGVNITTKNGILLFTHFFVPGFSDVDEDLRAGLMAAVLNAVQETHSGTGINTIDQGRYFVHIVEGEFTYGIFFSHENDLKVHNFANIVLQGFEFFFNKKLKKSISFNNDEFIKFQDFLNKKYNDLISIDVVSLSKIIEIMEESIFTDYIILEKPNLHQVFTHISSLPGIHKHANQIASMCKSLLEASLMIGHETTKIEFNLGENFYVFVDCFVKYVVILILQKKDQSKAIREIVRIHNTIESYFY